VKQLGSRTALSGASPVTPNSVIDQVSLSPSRVSMEKLPIAPSEGPRRRGRLVPVKYRV
jgi:hypothetical protein